MTTWHPQSFENLEQGTDVEFFAVGVDPNKDDTADPLFGGPVTITSAPQTPSGFNGAPTGQMVRAGSQGWRIRSDEYSAWVREGDMAGSAGAEKGPGADRPGHETEPP